MPQRHMLIKVALLYGAATLSAPRAHAQQDGLVAYPDVYKVQFENRYVRLIRVRLPGNARLASHSHPPGLMLHVYFNDAEPVEFIHDGPPNDVTRPPVQARSYRAGRATPETHAVNNLGSGVSDYMRVEFNTMGYDGQRGRYAAPPLLDATSQVVEMNSAQFRVTRVTIASGQSLELSAPTTEPLLLLALTDGISTALSGATRVLVTGDELFLDPSRGAIVRNGGATPIQLLRIDFVGKY